MTDKFKPGDRVFAKIKGWPPWPAKVVNRTPGKTETYYIQFFGTYDTSTVKPDSMYVYNDDNKAKYGKPKNSNRWKEAMEEIASNTAIGDSGPIVEDEEVEETEQEVEQPVKAEPDTDNENDGELMIDEGPSQPPVLTKEVKLEVKEVVKPVAAAAAVNNGKVEPPQPKGRRGSKASLSKRDSISSTSSVTEPSTPTASATPVQEVLVSRSGRKIKPKRFADDEISSPVSATGKGQDEPVEGPPSKRPKRAPKTPPAAKTATPEVKEPAPAPTRARMVIGKGKGAAAAGKSPASGPSGRMSPDISSPMPRVPALKPAATAAAPSLRKSEPASSKRALPALIPATGAASQAPLPPTRRAPSLRQQPKQEVFPQELEEEEIEQDEEEECETPPSLNLNADDNETETDDKENVKESAPSSNANDSEEEQEAMESESEMEKNSEMDDTSSRYSENIDESKIAFTDKEGQPFEVRFENKQDFENEEEKSEYETNLGGVAKIKEDIEQGDMDTHETLQELMEEGKDEFDPEDAILRERRAGQIRALRMEGEVIEIIGEIVSCLSEKQADCYRAIELLDRLGSHDLSALILKKHPEVVRIVGKLRNYVGNAENWTMSEDQLGEFKESASAIRGKAVDIYGSFYSLFIPPEERDSTVSFEDIFKEEMKVFKEMTMDMNLDEVLGLTAETEGGFEMFDAEIEA